MPQSWDMGHIFYFPSEGRHAWEDFYHTWKIQRLRPGFFRCTHCRIDVQILSPSFVFHKFCVTRFIFSYLHHLSKREIMKGLILTENELSILLVLFHPIVLFNFNLDLVFLWMIENEIWQNIPMDTCPLQQVMIVFSSSILSALRHIGLHIIPGMLGQVTSVATRSLNRSFLNEWPTRSRKDEIYKKTLKR
jgi:hypothetical protein